MIGKIVTGKSFYHAITYCLEDKRELSLEQKLFLSEKEGVIHLNRAEVLYYNLCSGNGKELIQDFSAVAHLSSRIEKPVMHLSLKLAPGEHLEKNKWVDIAHDFARDFKLENNQYVAIFHKDSKQGHIHILANRVGFDGRAVSDSNSYKRVAAFSRKMELKHGLKQLLNPHLFLSKEQRLEHKPEHRVDRRKERMKEFIRDHLLEAKDFTDFKLKMERDGFRIERGRGIAFIDEKNVRFKGSQLGYPLRKIENILEHKPALRLALKQQLEQEKQLQRKHETDTGDLKKTPQNKPDFWDSYWKTKQQNLERKQDGNASLLLLKDFNADQLLEALTRQEYEHSIPYELSREEEKRRRQRQNHHEQSR